VQEDPGPDPAGEDRHLPAAGHPGHRPAVGHPDLHRDLPGLALAAPPAGEQRSPLAPYSYDSGPPGVRPFLPRDTAPALGASAARSASPSPTPTPQVQSRGSTGSLSQARIANTNWCTRHSAPYSA